MYCVKCGAELMDTANFCTKCGAQVQQNRSQIIDTNPNEPRNVQQAGIIRQSSAAASAPEYSAPSAQQASAVYGRHVSAPAKRKSAIKAAAIVLAAVVVVGVLGVLTVTLGGRPHGQYVPADPSVSGIWFDSLRFEGGTVYVEAAGSSLGLDYKIKDGQLVFKNNYTLNINGEPMPKSMLFSKLKDGTIWLDGVQYIRVN